VVNIHRMRNKILLLFAALFFVLCGFCFGIALLAQIQGADLLALNAQVWWVFTFLPLGVGLVFLFFSQPDQKKPASICERPMKEAIRGHLKLSILFWILVYRKEKVKSLEDAKKEIFQEVRREISSDGWVEEVISEIQSALSRYK
jgi:hypothetical protein